MDSKCIEVKEGQEQQTTALAVQENIMGTMPVGKLILQMSLPMMFSMLVQSLYNIVDSIFVARLAENALTAVTLAMPLQSMMTAVTIGLSVGVNAVLSKYLGERDQDGVNRAAGNGLLMEWMTFILFVLVGLFAVEPFFAIQTSDPEIMQYGITYTRIVCILSFGVVNQVIMERLLISTGKTICSMASLFTGAVVNMILDPILIFGLFGCPAMGIAGAAYATVAAQSVAALLGTVLNLKVNKEIRFTKAAFQPQFQICKDMFVIGFPAILSNAANSVVAFGMNRILLSFTSTATAVYGVYIRLQGFAMMPVYGLRNTIVSILAYNYGAKHKRRIQQAIRICLATSISITVVVMMVFLIWPDGLLTLFSAQDHMMQIGMTALRIISIGTPATGITVILGAAFQSFGDSGKEFVVSAARVVVLLLSAWLLALSGALSVVWWAFVITEAVALLLALVFWMKVNRKFIKPMEQDTAPVWQ
ncbi:MAG: MATE family efflux transporter [Candidatus Pararuminococcus gallinarum]|jgi:putative MATE family efflux protein